MYEYTYFNLKNEARVLLAKGHSELVVETGFVKYVTWQTLSVAE